MQSSLPAEIVSDVSNYPNPFDSRRAGALGRTVITYTLAEASTVNIVIYDLMGFRVRTWGFSPGSSRASAGVNNVVWDGTNMNGDKVAKGGYIALIQVSSSAGFTQTTRKIGVIH